jgi:Protein of unknown function (DUF2490)
MISARRWWQAITLFVISLPLPARAQITEFFPEIDVYTGLTPGTQFWFQAKQTREDAAPSQAEIGPSLNVYVKHLGKLDQITIFDLDDSKKKLLVLSVGYRYLPSPGQPSENRILLMATLNVPMKGGLLVSDRNRLEINFTNGNTYWRYRNRPTLQKTIAIHSYHASPYASAEFYYNSKYGKWSSTTLYAGCIFPLGKKVELVPYYEHANETGVSPNQQTEAFGLILNLFFRRNER